MHSVVAHRPVRRPPVAPAIVGDHPVVRCQASHTTMPGRGVRAGTVHQHEPLARARFVVGQFDAIDRDPPAGAHRPLHRLMQARSRCSTAAP